MQENVTITDIAKELDINISTVSRALKDHPNISEATKERVRKVAQKLNYHPNNIASALANGQSRLIGVMVPYTDENFFASAIRGIEEVAKKEGYQIVIFQSNDRTEDEIQNFKAMLAAKVDGILASHAMETKDFEHYQHILDQEIPLILFDRFHESVDANIIAIDDFKGAYQTVTHLIDQGCKKIFHFTGNQHVHIYKERTRGFKQALSDHGLTSKKKFIFESNMSLKQGRELTSYILEKQELPDAIFSANDYLAVGAMQVLQEQGIRVPQDVAIAGFSNETFATLTSPTLTSVNQHPTEMGQTAARLFLNQINDEDNTRMIPKKTILSPELIIRDSSRRK